MQISLREEDIMKKNVKFLVGTVLLIVLLALGIKGTVTSREYGQDKVDKAVLRQLEQTYVSDVKTLLTNSGYENRLILRYVSPF